MERAAVARAGVVRAAGVRQAVGERGGDFVQSFDRGLAVIRAFGPEHQHLTLSEVAARTGLTRAAARRFLLTLAELGYVHADGRMFSLRPRILELGYAYLSTLDLDEVAAPHMELLVAATRESSSVTVLDGDDIVYVVRVPTRRIMTVTIAVGTRFAAYATSMGRVLLAALSAEDLDSYLARADLAPLTARTVTSPERLRAVLREVGLRGYAVVDQELEDVWRGADEDVGYSAHIKPMFRSRDRQSMSFVFDLWSYDDVVTHAAAILERLDNGSMPCDGAWPAEKIDVFRRWATSGSRA